MKLEHLKTTYLNELAVRGYAKGTIACRKTYLSQCLFFFQSQGVVTAGELTRQVIYDYQLRLIKQTYKPLTLHSKLSVLSGFLGWLLKEKHLLLDLAQFIAFPKRVLTLSQRILSETEVRQLLSLPNIKTKRGIRDKSILELLYSTGIRRAELVRLNLYDLNWGVQTLRVTGKGNKERIVPIGSVALYWVEQYLQSVRCPKASREQALFLAHNRRMSINTVNNIIADYREMSGLNKRITPHTLRHSCATHLLQHGADVRHIQELLGHASPATTQIYARVAICDLQRVFSRSHPRALRASAS